MELKPKYILATHVWSDGPSQGLAEYLTAKEIPFVWIAHPLYDSPKRPGSGYELFDGKAIASKQYDPSHTRRPTIIKYLGEFVLNILWGIRFSSGAKPMYIGYDALNAASGIVLKWFGRVSKTIYYVVDYVPRRFENRMLNRLFHKVDQWCVKYADETWNLNERGMNAARLKYHHFDAHTPGYSLQREVPMGFWKSRVTLKNTAEIHTHQVAFMGHMIEKQGVQFVLHAWPKVLEVIHDAHFLAIGAGPYLDELKSLAQTLGIASSVTFTGFVDKLSDIEDMLASSGLAVALYEEGDPERNFTYHTDPGKVKVYLGAGLPTLISDVPPIARELVTMGCGRIIGNDPKEIAQAIIQVLHDPKVLTQMREHVLQYREQFDWEHVFTTAGIS